jgi:integrase
MLFQRKDSPFWHTKLSNGKRVSTGIPCSRSLRERALQAAAEKERELQELIQAARSLTLKQATTLFLRDSADTLKASTLHHYAKKLAVIIDVMNSPTIAEINLEWLKGFVRERRRQTSDIQIRREITALSSLMEYAIDRELEGAPEVNPCRLFRKKGLKKPVKKPRWLTVAQVRALLHAAARLPSIISRRFWVAFITLVLETGLRHEEALGLLWDEVDLSRRVIFLPADREKAGRGRIVPLSDTAMDTLLHVPRDPRINYVFVNPKTRTRYNSIGKGWVQLRIKAGVPHARIHDLRHTFASWTRQSGMSREDRKDVLGHLDDTTHGGYANASIESLVETVNKHSPSTLLSQEQEL